jgi:hypothetical protein
MKVSSLASDIDQRRRQIVECYALIGEVQTDKAYADCRAYILASLYESVVRHEAELTRLEEIQRKGDGD